jgi:polyhydroxyalkanoate synthesis regulator phasin
MTTARTSVSDRIRSTYEQARAQIRDFEKQAAKIEKKAKAQLDDVPSQLKTAWQSLLGKLRALLALVNRDELKAMSEKIEELAKKVDKLVKKAAPHAKG